MVHEIQLKILIDSDYQDLTSEDFTDKDLLINAFIKLLENEGIILEKVAFAEEPRFILKE